MKFSVPSAFKFQSPKEISTGGDDGAAAVDPLGNRFNLQRRLALVETVVIANQMHICICFNLQRRLALVETHGERNEASY